MCRCMGAISVTPFCRTHLQRYKKNATFASFITIKFPQTDFFSQHPSKHPKLLTLFALFLEINCCFAFLYYYVLHSSEKCRIFASRSANGAHRCLTAFDFCFSSDSSYPISGYDEIPFWYHFRHILNSYKINILHLLNNRIPEF